MGRALFGYTVVNLGCKVNRVEADGFERLLAERGGVPVGERNRIKAVVGNILRTL